LRASRQTARPIKIGDYCFTGTGCVILGGSALPSFSVLGAGSLLNKELTETYTLYGGTPARPIKPLSRNCGYFCREEGIVL
jgi:acetyltransferase-like isoleucine patch superfamily enzyme